MAHERAVPQLKFSIFKFEIQKFWGHPAPQNSIFDFFGDTEF